MVFFIFIAIIIIIIAIAISCHKLRQHNHHFCSVSLVEVLETLENLTTLCLSS